MPTHTLDSSLSQDVSSFQTLDTVIDTPDQGPRHLLIFTGIAAARWDSKGDLDPLTVIVKLGAIVATAPRKGDWTAIVGLSNIDNRDSDFIFALNTVSVDVDSLTNELQLTVDLAVQGDGHAILNSFSFQVTVLTEPPRIELESLLVSPDGLESFTRSASVPTGSRWKARVTLTTPAPRDVDVFLFSAIPSVAPMQAGAPGFASVTVKRHETVSLPFTAAPTNNPSGTEIDVTITAAVVAGNQTAVVKVLPAPK